MSTTKSGANDDELESEELTAPEHWMTDEEVEATSFNYSTRAPDDWVISGPLANNGGIGRWFETWGAADRWAREFYGARFKGPVVEPDDTLTRWAFLIRGPRGASK